MNSVKLKTSVYSTNKSEHIKVGSVKQ